MPRPIVQQLPPAPQRGEDFQTFTEKANAHVAALTSWTDDVNELAEWVNDAAVDVEQNAQTAVDAAQSASNVEAVVLAAADFQGEWSALTGALSVPASVYHDGVYWRLLTDLADVTASEPSEANADWALAVPAVDSLPASEGQAGDVLVRDDEGGAAFGTSLRRYDLASVSATETLDLAQSNVFRVDASAPRTLVFANAPGANRAMTVVVHISASSAVAWPDGIDWDDDEAPELGDTETKVVLFWDGVEWSGFVRVAK